MAQYYKDCPAQKANPENPPAVAAEVRVLSEFGKLCETLLTDDAEEGWASELRRYLGSCNGNPKPTHHDQPVTPDSGLAPTQT